MKNQPKKEKEMEIPNLLAKKPGYTLPPITVISKTKKKSVKGKVIAGVSVLLFLGLVVMFYKGIYMTNEFFKGHELRFQKVIEIKIQKPVKIMTKEEIKKEQELDKEIDGIVEKALEIYYATPTPSQKPQSSTIKPVEAKENNNYTYTAHSGKKYYPEIIDGLKKRFVNWQDAAELIAKESGFDPMVKNGIGACGLWQSNPCSKMDCKLEDIGCQLNWGKDYISDRYGTVSEALSFWKSRTNRS